MALWLPESYEGGDLTSEDMEILEKRLKDLGYEELAQLIRQDSSLGHVIFAFDTKSGKSHFLTNVIVGRERILSFVTPSLYIENVAANFETSDQYRVIEKDVVQLSGREAGRLVVSAKVDDMAFRQLMYCIKDDRTMWFILFTTAAEEFTQRLPVFEQSALTFAIRS